MSEINTGSINVNHPIPGTNNQTQGFRDNFSSIKANLDTAASELSDLQTKAVLKSALNGTVLDNNMNHSLISNALTHGFSRTARSLGSNLSGTILIDVSKADVHYGTVADNITLNFTNWPLISGEYPLCSIHLILTVPTSRKNSIITFSKTNKFDDSKLSIENYKETSNGFSVTTPRSVTELHYIIYTKDCGETLTIFPVNRSQKTNQISTTVPSSTTGRVGDRAGHIAVDTNNLYLCIADHDGTTPVWKKIDLIPF